MSDLAIGLLCGCIGLALAILMLAKELDRQWVLVPREAITHVR